MNSSVPAALIEVSSLCRTGGRKTDDLAAQQLLVNGSPRYLCGDGTSFGDGRLSLELLGSFGKLIYSHGLNEDSFIISQTGIYLVYFQYGELVCVAGEELRNHPIAISLALGFDVTLVDSIEEFGRLRTSIFNRDSKDSPFEFLTCLNGNSGVILFRENPDATINVIIDKEPSSKQFMDFLAQFDRGVDHRAVVSALLSSTPVEARDLLEAYLYGKVSRANVFYEGSKELGVISGPKNQVNLIKRGENPEWISRLLLRFPLHFLLEERILGEDVLSLFKALRAGDKFTPQSSDEFFAAAGMSLAAGPWVTQSMYDFVCDELSRRGEVGEFLRNNRERFFDFSHATQTNMVNVRIGVVRSFHLGPKVGDERFVMTVSAADGVSNPFCLQSQLMIYRTELEGFDQLKCNGPCTYFIDGDSVIILVAGMEKPTALDSTGQAMEVEIDWTNGAGDKEEVQKAA